MKLNLTPVIDVVFLLIIFFMLVCQFIVAENFEVTVPDDISTAAEANDGGQGITTVTVMFDQDEQIVYAVGSEKIEALGANAVTEAIKAKFETTGQDCLGVNRIFVERPIYDKFCTKFTAATKALTIGKGMDDCDLGPLMNEKAVQKQEEHVANALAKGAKLACGGKRHELGQLFYEATVLTDVPNDALIMSDETFGPVGAIAPFDTEEQVINWANETEYGLVAYVHSDDPKRIYRVSRALQFGMVAVNRTKVTGAPIPFGGTKQSGLGREGARRGMEEFMEIKYVCRDWA